MLHLKHALGAALMGLLLVVLAVCSLPPVTAQSDLMTLVPPTLLPTDVPPTATPPVTISALAKMRADKDHPHLSIGILYNARPFSWLDSNGQVLGFEADIGRAIAQDWGCREHGCQKCAGY